MNCEKFEDVAGDLARNQMIEADVRRAALNHSAECFKCSERLRDEQALTRGLSLLSEQMATIGASNEIETRLREALSQSFVAQPAVAAFGRRRSYWLAIAAAILVIVGTIIGLNWQGQSRGHKEVAEQPPVVPDPQKSKQFKKPEIIANTDSERKLVKSPKPRSRSTPLQQTRRQTEVVANHAEEIATDFIPLRNINSANLEDGGHMVRVELPRSALVKFGLPVNMDRFNEKVKADVWLGVDGLAHAIRFVQ